MMPTNLIAQSIQDAESRHKVFPNLARGQNPPAEVIEAVSAICDDELKAAGITSHILPNLADVAGEVPSRAFGSLCGWSFRRAWYYWIARGPGIPPEIAEELHATHGKEVRVEGHCGCPSPREYCKGFAVSSYHVDTQEGLKALADTLRSIKAGPRPTAQLLAARVDDILNEVPVGTDTQGVPVVSLEWFWDFKNRLRQALGEVTPDDVTQDDAIPAAQVEAIRRYLTEDVPVSLRRTTGEFILRMIDKELRAGGRLDAPK